MAEKERIVLGEPNQLVATLEGRASDRQLRLFACACCRATWFLVRDDRSQQAVITAEAFADREASEPQLLSAMLAAWTAAHESPDAFVAACGAAAWATDPDPWTAASNAALALTLSERRNQADPAKLLRAIQHDIFPDGPRVSVVVPAWKSPDVLSLARDMYRQRCFDRMALLADHLEQAGCTNPVVQNHCRSGNLHVRGCWLIDALLDLA